MVNNNNTLYKNDRLSFFSVNVKLLTVPLNRRSINTSPKIIIDLYYREKDAYQISILFI